MRLSTRPSFAFASLTQRSAHAPRRKLSTARADTESIAGTAPFHNAYVLLHARRPPSAYPSKVPSALQRALQRAAGAFGGIVNFAWSPEQPVLHRSRSHSTLEEERAEWDEEDEAYRATVFSRYGGQLDVPVVSMRDLQAVVRQLEAHASPSGMGEELSGENGDTSERDGTLHLYVCTHGARDCRCGEHGGAVYSALRAEVEKRGLRDKVNVAGVGHVGGHKYAANLLVYPYGEWLGHLRPEHVPDVLDAALTQQRSSAPFCAETTPPLMPQFWRGRMGLDKYEQLRLFSPDPDPDPQPEDGSSLSAMSRLQPHASRR